MKTSETIGWLPPAVASILLGLTVRQLANLADENKVTARIGKGGKREYLFPESREQYQQAKIRAGIAEEMAKYAPRTDSPDAAKARLANAQADMVEFDLARKRGEYVSLAFHLREIEELAARLREPLTALGSVHREASLTLTPDTVDAFWEHVEDELRAKLHEATSQHNADDSDPASEPTPDAG